MYCMGYNIASIKQFFCRARKSKANGHIQIRKLTESEEALINHYYPDNLKEWFNDFKNAAIHAIDLYKKCIYNESTLYNVVGVVKVTNRDGIMAKDWQERYDVSELQIWGFISNIIDKERLSSYNGIKKALAGYYDEIVLIRDYNKAKEKIDKYMGRDLSIEDRDELRNYMNYLGYKGKSLGPIIKNIGYKLEELPSKKNYRITEMEEVQEE